MLDSANSSIDSNRYLIIGGVPKSATTSLFRYLADHPEVCPASRKETYFFAPEFDYEHVGGYPEDPGFFTSYFTHCHKGQVRMEATPYTLYAKDAAQKIATMLPDTLALFILRDPVERLISDYYFHVQRQHPHVQDSFDAFLEFQFNQKNDVPNLIELGCYIDFLHPFLEILGSENVLIMTFEDFVTNPVAELTKLCSRLGISEDFYENYNFKVHNRTIRDVRFPWINRMYIKLEPVMANLRVNVMRYPKAHRLFENIMNMGKSTYHILNNRKSSSREHISDTTRQALVNYYQPYTQALMDELDYSFPWKSFKPIEIGARSSS